MSQLMRWKKKRRGKIYVPCQTRTAEENRVKKIAKKMVASL